MASIRIGFEPEVSLRLSDAVVLAEVVARLPPVVVTGTHSTARYDALELSVLQVLGGHGLEKDRVLLPQWLAEHSEGLPFVAPDEPLEGRVAIVCLDLFDERHVDEPWSDHLRAVAGEGPGSRHQLARAIDWYDVSDGMAVQWLGDASVPVSEFEDFAARLTGAPWPTPDPRTPSPTYAVPTPTAHRPPSPAPTSVWDYRGVIETAEEAVALSLAEFPEQYEPGSPVVRLLTRKAVHDWLWIEEAADLQSLIWLVGVPGDGMTTGHLFPEWIDPWPDTESPAIEQYPVEGIYYVWARSGYLIERGTLVAGDPISLETLRQLPNLDLQIVPATPLPDA
jgi:hypothetical protein